MKEILKDWQIRILDDDPADIAMIERRLRKDGFNNFKSSVDYNEFLEELNNSVIVIIIDHQLHPMISGLDIMKLAVNKVPICYPIIVSGNENGEVIMSYMNNDAFRYLVKKGNYLDELVKYIKEAHSKIVALSDIMYA